MASRHPVTLTEHSSVVIPRDLLSEVDLLRLDQLVGAGALRVRHDKKGQHVTAVSTVGVVRLDHISLTIEPKVAFDAHELLAWCAYAARLPVPPPGLTRGWSSGLHGFAELVTTALVQSCRGIVRNGLRRDYRTVELVDTAVRGRIDIRQQVARRFGQVDQIYQRACERTPAVWENIVCGVALRHAASLSDSAWGRKAAELSRAFPGADQTPRQALQLLRRGTYHRMNRPYREAHVWAQLVLQGLGVTELLTDGNLLSGAMLIRMDQLWEDITLRLVQDCLEPGMKVIRKPPSIQVTETGRYRRSLLPDMVLHTSLPNGIVMTPIDAKYKAYGVKALGVDDLHQLLTYAVAYAGSEPPSALVLYPSPTGSTHRLAEVTAPAGKIGRVGLIGIDTSQGPRHAIAELRPLVGGLGTVTGYSQPTPS